MSDTAAEERRRANRQAALEKGRETMRANRVKQAAMRAEIAREEKMRSAADVHPVHSAPAERSDPIREERHAEVADEPLPLPPRRSRDDRSGMLEIPEHLKKPGWDYQYMTIRVLNEPVDNARLRDFTDNGQWRPAKAKDFPSLVDPGTPPNAPIEIEGQRLYERPMSYTLQARQEDYIAAEEQRRDKLAAAAAGRSTGNNDPGMVDNRLTRRVPVEVVIEEASGRLGGGRR